MYIMCVCVDTRVCVCAGRADRERYKGRLSHPGAQRGPGRLHQPGRQAGGGGQHPGPQRGSHHLPQQRQGQGHAPPALCHGAPHEVRRARTRQQIKRTITHPLQADCPSIQPLSFCHMKK